ncbi:sensor histidine kinase [Paenibacillus soyae]|uniref:histidine kinase n=1 Tax=Paenibacillus soyae TaxID=2969249 RepID=A0A9X2SAB5_9BACL|nr:sensor histidine kinase [Paenibacillus soyae]MCR2804398.1 sensor histidine kinase [Paenibacillus soyae]
MFGYFRFISIKSKMVLLFLLMILIPIVTMFINSYLSSQKLLERKYTDLLMDISKQSNIRVEEFLEDTRRISLISSYGINSYLSAVSQENYPIQNYLKEDSKRNENQATQLLMNYIRMKDLEYAIYVYNFNGGKNLYISTDSPVDYTYHPGDEEWFADFLESEDITRDIAVVKDKQTKRANNLSILNVRKIYDMENGDLIGVMTISIPIDFINKLNDRLQEDSRSAYTIVDSNGLVLFNNNYEQIGKMFAEVLSIEDGPSPGTARQVISSEGKDYLLISTPFEDHDWVAYLYMPVRELAVEGYLFKRNLIVIAAVLLLFAITGSFYLSNHITKPIKRLMSNMLLVEKGRFENLPEVKSNDEIGLLASRFEQMSGELKILVERIYQEQQEKSEAEIKALQAQINPHFLYNTLNSVKWIASMQRSDKIVQMTEALISLLRYATSNESRLVPIREELEQINHYITIQKVRYFNKIDVVYDIDESLLEHRILKLTVQPIVENAIFHGVADMDGEGVITITVYESGEEAICIAVSDNGQGMNEEAAANLQEQLSGNGSLTGGIGVRNVHYRIKKVFGSPFGISFNSKPKQGSTFVITIPRNERGS